ncbi:MAG: transporter substrate-binding domain-containing protein [Burkholderiales bacterium]|nr:transporter substrate-binding domain-containing protein [Burkholderiales bacterium]
MRRHLLLLALVVPAMILPAAATTFVADTNPPFNYIENGKLAGLAPEITAEMARRAQLPATFEHADWDAGYQRAQKDRDTCLLSLARVESRDKLFHWVGPIGVNRWGVFGKTDFAGKVAKVEDLRPYRIGGVTRDAKLEYLAQYAVTNISSVSDDRKNPARLNRPKDDPDRIDLWITGAFTARKMSRENGGPKLKAVYTAKDVPLYVACSTGTPRTTVKALNEALTDMKRDGTLKRITDRHLQQFAE